MTNEQKIQRVLSLSPLRDAQKRAELIAEVLRDQEARLRALELARAAAARQETERR